MKFTTEIWAVDPRANPEYACPIKWAGPIIEARSWEEAEEILQINGMGYARVTGKLVKIEEFDGREVVLRESPWIFHD